MLELSKQIKALKETVKDKKQKIANLRQQLVKKEVDVPLYLLAWALVSEGF